MTARRISQDENGTGVVGTAFGAGVFIAFLLLATHVLLSLYASSVVASTTWDAARYVADNEQSDAVSVAETKARHRLRGFENVTVELTRDADQVFAQITTDRPMFLPTALAKRSGLTRIDKTVRTKTETWQ